MPSSRAESINCKSALADRNLVPDDQIRIFCEALQFRYEYGEGYHNEEARTIYANRLRPLLPKLKFPISNNPGFAWKLILPKQSEYCHLCDIHKGLNADFVHQWFKFLALEVGARLEILRASHSDFLGGYAWDNIIKPLTRLHKIWETEARVRDAFGDFTDTGLKRVSDLIPNDRQQDKCEACILARIGSHAPTLFALRATVKSRISRESALRHPSRLRLLRLIDPWIELWQARLDSNPKRSEARKQQMQENRMLADELYRARIQLESYQQDMTKFGRPSFRTANVQAEEEAKGIFYEAENDIIDSYAALRATQRQSQLLRAQDTHRRSEKHAVDMIGEEVPYMAKVDPAYRESRYSIDTVRNNQRVVYGRDAAAADLEVPRRARQADSIETCWEDVMCGGGGGRGMGSPFD